MRRLLIIAAATATLLAPLAVQAQGRGGRDGGDYGRYAAADRDRGDRDRDRGGRSGDRPGDRGGYDRRGDGRDYGGARGEDSRGRYEPRYDPRSYPGSDPRAAPPAYQAAPRGRQAYRQGQYLPPMYRGGVVQDPGRYRLRQPPRGYDWVGVGPDIYLMQRGTGMVLDAIPGGF